MAEVDETVVYALRYIVATCGAALLGLAATLPVFAMGLVVPATVVLPLALLVGALVSAVVAGWVCNVGVRDRSRLPAVMGVAVASAVVLAALTSAAFFVPALDAVVWGGGAIYSLGACELVISSKASVAALLFRGARGRLGWDGAAVLLASIVGPAFLLAMENAWLIPWIPDVRPGWYRFNYETMVQVSLAALAIGVFLTILRSRRISSGHELGRDAAMTFALLAAILPAATGTISLACSTFVGCGA